MKNNEETDIEITPEAQDMYAPKKRKISSTRNTATDQISISGTCYQVRLNNQIMYVPTMVAYQQLSDDHDKLKTSYDRLEANYKNAQNAIRSLSKQIKVIEDQLKQKVDKHE